MSHKKHESTEYGTELKLAAVRRRRGRSGYAGSRFGASGSFSRRFDSSSPAATLTARPAAAAFPISVQTACDAA